MKDLSNTPEKNVFGDRIDTLTEFLDQAATLMGRRFTAPAEIDYMVGAVRRTLSFRKSGERCTILEAGPPAYDPAPLREKSIAIRVEAIAHLEELWEACLVTDGELCLKVETAINTVSTFLREHGTQR